MPAIFHTFADGSYQFALRPNGSLTAAGARRFLWVTGAMMAAISVYFAARGFWPVLPFAGLEFGVLVWALRASMRASRRVETILIDGDAIRVECREAEGSAVHRDELARHWARVALRAAPVATHPVRLTIESHGRAIEVGRFLTDAEKRSLAPDLRRLIGRVGETPAGGADAGPPQE